MNINYKVYQKLAQTQDARIRCKEQNNMEWFDKHTESIENIMLDFMPHGSGIDGNTTFNFDKSNADKIVIDSEYHAMDENGFYDGWINFNVTVKPSLFLGKTLDIRGNFGKYQHVKDYLYQVFDEALDAEYMQK